LERKCKLGAGTYGTVYCYRHYNNPASPQSYQRYAVKEISTTSSDGKFVSIVSELKVLYQNNCDNIVKLYGTAIKEGHLCMILEYCDCGSLDDVRKTMGTLPERILSLIAAQILKGLKYLHSEREILHRDIKPANILLTSKGEVKLADFGVAGHKMSPEQTEWETFSGTFTYMSPERIKGDKHSFSSDIWSLGLTLAECALGRFPFNIKEISHWDLIMYFEENCGEPIKLPADQFSEEFREFIAACMKYDPSQRSTAKELLEFEFIKKYQDTKPSLKTYLTKEYVAKKQAQKSNTPV
jgi:serine/threonine protein kinase